MDLDLDLNLANYDLPDLLTLFKLDYDFDSEDLKRVKKMVLKTHPDKAPDLPKDYFLFFSEAYKMLYAVYQFRYKSTETNITHAKPVYYVEKDEEHDLLLQQLRAKPNFNKIFNDLFEKHFLQQDCFLQHCLRLGDNSEFYFVPETRGRQYIKVKLPDGEIVKAASLSGASNLLFRRNSLTGGLEVVMRTGTWGGLNSILHAN